MIIDELFEAPQQCPECGGISFSNLILAEKKDACYHKVKASAKVWPSAYASGRLVQCRKKGAANYGNKSEGVMEMDKSQTPPGRDGSNDPDAGKKEYTAKTITPNKVAKHGAKILNKIFNKKKGVAEEYELAGVDVAYDLGRRAYRERKTIKDNPYSATREARKYDEWEKGLERGKHDANDARLFRSSVGEQGMLENAAPQLSVQQLATISDTALDQAYGYGRSTPGNTFGWQANLKSAAYAKQMIDQGVTDIEAISDAIHKGWNTTAQAFVQDPKQFDDTAKLAAAGKLEAKLQQRAQLMKQNYAQLPEEEKEKDRVVARALLQAIRGEQPGVAEDNLNELDMFAPVTTYVRLANGTYVAANWRRNQNLSTASNSASFIDIKPLAPAAAKQLGLDQRLNDPEKKYTGAATIASGGPIQASGPLADRTINVVDIRDPKAAKDSGVPDTLFGKIAQWAQQQSQKQPGVSEGVMYGAEELNVGDPVVITGNVEFEGKTGEIAEFGRDKRFVVVDLYNHGQHSFHSSDVSFNEYAGSDDEEARMHDAGEFGDDPRDDMDEAKKQPPEAKYDDEYDAMVARVRKLAGIGPMKTVYDPAKRVYRNMPTAQQPKK